MAVIELVRPSTGDAGPYDESVTHTAGQPPATGSPRDSQQWVDALGGEEPGRTDAVDDLHRMLLSVALGEAARRAGTHGLRGPELDDLAHQAAADATMSILRRLEDFRGESRFTTWAYKFVVFEMSNKVGRHVWRRDGVQLAEGAWERLPQRLGDDPEDEAEAAELVRAIKHAVDHELTDHQRRTFVAIVLNGTPLDVLTVEWDTNRNAIYKTMFDARRKLRRYLQANDLLPKELR